MAICLKLCVNIIIRMLLLFTILLGLVFGSFVAAYTYRFQNGLSNFSGRSFCDTCHKKLFWYDNIPLLSYFILGGISRCCGKKISSRYPIIEFGTSMLFVVCYLNRSLYVSIPCYLIILNLIFFLILVSVFIIDYENYIIPDELVYLLTVISVLVILISPSELTVYNNLFSGFLISVILLLLHLITNKKGMGLGDVKLVLPLGIFLGLPDSLIFLLLSFVIGAIIGLILIFLGNKKLKSKIPFGPFLIISFFVIYFYSDIVRQLIIPM